MTIFTAKRSIKSTLKNAKFDLFGIFQSRFYRAFGSENCHFALKEKHLATMFVTSSKFRK